MTAAVAIPPPMSFPQLDAAVARVREAAKEFTRLTLDERIALVRALRDGYRDIAEESARLACEAKGLPWGTPVSGEEWLTTPMTTLRVLRFTQQSLEDLKNLGAPRLDLKHARTLADGRFAFRVFPADAFDAALLAKHVAEAWMESGITRENIREHQAAFYKKPHDGRVCLVLGAGNVNAIPPTDAIQKLFNEGTVCVLKMNPVNAYLGPLIERAFAPLVSRGYLAVVYGGAEEGAHLVNHDGIDEIHITGSDKTYDMMVWGPPGPEREARKARNEPVLEKLVTSELGNITPTVVVPGDWDDKALDFQARNTAGMVCNNASFNCTAAKLLVTSKAWPQREKFLERLAHWMEIGQVRKAYYPGADQRFRQFTEGRANVRLIGHATDGQLPYALITDVDRTNESDRVFNQEPWCTVISEICLETTDPVAFCEEATKFLNEKVWGTLTANVLVHPSTEKEPKAGQAVDAMLRNLKYGGVAVNTFAGAIFGAGSMPWGGHPGSTPQNIQSGTGRVHDPMMLDGIEKVVLRAPVTQWPIPLWFPGHRTVDQVGRKLVDFEHSPSWLKVPGLALAAMRG